MGKNNFRRMMMLRDHEKNREPERDRLEEERDRREREMERRLHKLEGGNDRYPYYPQEENRYIDPYPIHRHVRTVHTACPSRRSARNRFAAFCAHFPRQGSGG